MNIQAARLTATAKMPSVCATKHVLCCRFVLEGTSGPEVGTCSEGGFVSVFVTLGIVKVLELELWRINVLLGNLMNHCCAR